MVQESSVTCLENKLSKSQKRKQKKKLKDSQKTNTSNQSNLSTCNQKISSNELQPSFTTIQPSISSNQASVSLQQASGSILQTSSTSIHVEDTKTNQISKLPESSLEKITRNILSSENNQNICLDCSSDTNSVNSNKGLLSKAVLNDYESACKNSEQEVKHFFDSKGIYTYSTKPLSGNKKIPLYSATGPSTCKTPLFISCAEQLIYTFPSNSDIVTTNSNMSDKNNAQELTRDDVKAQREAKKALKLAAKQKAKVKNIDGIDKPDSITKAEIKEKPTDKKQLQQSSTQENNKPMESKKSVVSNTDTPSNSEKNDKINNNKENVVQEEKSKAQLKAERRAKQEQQRQAKATALAEKSKPTKLKSVDRVESKIITEKVSKPEILKPKNSNVTSKTKDADNVKATTLVHKVKLFNHLYRDNLSVTSSSDVHPAIFRLGVQYSTGVVRGSNARCVALLNALKCMVSDYTTPSEKEYSRGFEERLLIAMLYLNKCRPHSVSMINALRHFKSHLTPLPNDITDTQARLKLKETIDTYIHEQVDMAGDAICMYVQKKITEGDVILTYTCSSLVEKILLTAHRKGTQFRVVIVDAGPWYEGKEMLRRLVYHEIECTYVLLSAVSYIMREVTKVIIGAHALLSNGAVMSRAGTADVALVAQAFNVPVLAACETHKFCERVQTDALVFNELGDPDELISDKSSAKNWKALSHLTPLSITYDITPSHLVTAVITELAIVPCTSVPVVLRVKPTETQ